MSDAFLIGDRWVGRGHKPFIIAEMSCNHNQSLERALEIVRVAAKTGVDALKLQTYTPDTMTLDLNEREFFISNPDTPWEGTNLYDLYKKAYMPWEWHAPIMALCKELGVMCFSTPFDETAVDFLESMDVPCYKIASFENTDVELVRKVASTGKPLIISTGMASIAEIDETVRAARDSGCKNLVLLKCTSSYPASPAQSNLMTIPHMADLFKCQIGLSDHTLGVGVSVASVALGATVIEKHFILSRSDGGPDSTFSMEPDEMEALVVEAERAWLSLGNVCYGPSDEKEEKSKQFRRSLYVVQDVKKGDVLTANNLRAIRPGLGLPTKYIKNFLGRSVSKDVVKGTPLDWSILG